MRFLKIFTEEINIDVISSSNRRSVVYFRLKQLGMAYLVPLTSGSKMLVLL
jgi:hypothetical protein